MIGTDLDQACQAAGDVAVATADGRAVRATVDKAGPVGVSVRDLEVTAPQGPIVDRATQLAAELRPGGDRLKLVEVDPDLGGATLRTRPEEMRRGRFYQVDLSPDRVRIRRYQVQSDGSRARQGFDLTREQMRSLVDDLAYTQPDLAE